MSLPDRTDTEGQPMRSDIPDRKNFSRMLSSWARGLSRERSSGLAAMLRAIRVLL